MLFNSIHFLIFFPLVVALYFGMPYRLRSYFLLAASYYFYMCWKVEYILLIIISTLIDYSCGIAIAGAGKNSTKRAFLLLSLITNLGLLFSFKYYNFFSGSTEQFLGSFNILYHLPSLKVLLPVGISFYTFQTLSYTIEVYRGKIDSEKNLKNFALYVAFFPQLVAGPIERADRLLPQLKAEHDFNLERFMSGFQLIVWGFFKKLVIADRLALLVNHVYASPHEQSSAALLLATYFFAFQIYCDFSGYSDIAIGTARILGVELMKNFNRPYHSKSIHEFWSRWHISLSTWFRDYLYIPLGGNRVSGNRWMINIMIVFVVSGLWHGANWTFVVWGFIHGAYLLIGRVGQGVRDKISCAVGLVKKPELQTALKMFITFHLVLLSWIFFRAQNISDAWYVLKSILGFKGYSEFFAMLCMPDTLESTLGLNLSGLLISVTAILALEITHLVVRHRENHPQKTVRVPLWNQYWLNYIVVLVILIFGVFNSNEFIYFQF